tara:strand:+ start:661 stop:1389 length:729 start_codon:yes stop_codon:yes gene_type:complete
MSLVIKGSSSGQVTVDVPAVAGTNTITIPATTGSLITSSVTGDFTVDTTTFKVDSTNNRVGIGTASPTKDLDVVNSGNACIRIIGGTSSCSQIQFGDTDANDIGDICYDHSINGFKIYTNSGERFRMEADGDFHADGDVIAFSTTVSDIALKTDIEMIPNALDKIDEVRGVTFTRHNGQKSAGIIAQELEKVLPEAVREKKLALHDGKEYKTVEYDAIHGLLINCIKELKEKVRKLENGSTS